MVSADATPEVDERLGADHVSDTGRRLGWRHRRILAWFWGLFGAGCWAFLLHGAWWRSWLFLLPMLGGLAFLVSAAGFYRGRKWGRFSLGFWVAGVTLYGFDRLLNLHFRGYHGLYFWLICGLLLAAFYTWLFLFSGLDPEGGPGER